MDKKILSLLIGVMFMIGLVSAWNTNTFNNSLTQEDLGFLEIIQEESNGYSYSGSWDDISKGYDGDWATSTDGSSGALFYANYTKPYWADDSSIWKYQIDAWEREGSLSGVYEDCFLQSPLQFKIELLGSLVTTSCWSGTDWETYGTRNFDNFTEEAMVWKSREATRYLKVPDETYLTNGYLNLTGLSSFYEENSTEYYFYKTGADYQNANDGDWDSYTQGDWVVLYQNYSTAGAKNTTSIQIKRVVSGDPADVETTNFTIPWGCLNGTKMETQMFLFGGNAGDFYEGCRQLEPIVSSWQTIDNDGNVYGKFYEDAINWEYDNLTNPSLSIDETEVWNYTGIYDFTNKTMDLVETINNYISTASSILGYYYVPFLFESESIGALKYLALNFDDDGFYEHSQSYSASSYDTASETFDINLSYSPSSYTVISANLYYNGSEYVGVKTGTGTNVLFSTTFQLPSNGIIVEQEFYWTIALTNGSGTFYYNSTFNNQSVSPMLIQFCDDTYNVTALNFTLKEESTFLNLNGSLEATFDYWISGTGEVSQTYSFSNMSDGNTHFQFCISPGDKTFKTDAVISYLKTGYDRREYLLENYTISNETEEIALYLSTTDSTDMFTFTVKDENQDIVPGAFIRVQRWDIGTDNFYTVGMIETSSDGTGIINMRLNDAWYRYQVLYDNQLYLTTDPVKESTTSRTLNIDFATENPYNQFEEIDYSLTYNEETNTTTFTFADTTGAVQIGCLKIIKMNGLGNTEIYYSCVESTSGALSYEINDSGTYTIRGIIRLTSEYGSVEKVIDEIIRQGDADKFVIMGRFGSVISLLLVGTMAMIGIAAGSIILGLGLILVTLILVNLIGWLNISAGVIYGLVSIMILILLTLRRKNG